MCYKRGNPGPCGMTYCGCSNMPTTLYLTSVYTPVTPGTCTALSPVTIHVTLTYNATLGWYTGTLFVAGTNPSAGGTCNASLSGTYDCSFAFKCGTSNGTFSLLVCAYGFNGSLFSCLFGGDAFNLPPLFNHAATSCGSVFAWSGTGTLGAGWTASHTVTS